MKIREERITILHNGEARSDAVLDEKVPSAVIYIENTDFANRQAAGLTKRENRIEVTKRTIAAFFETAFATLDELDQIDPAAAAEMRAEYLANEEPDEPETLHFYRVPGEYCTAARFVGSGK